MKKFAFMFALMLIGMYTFAYNPPDTKTENVITSIAQDNTIAPMINLTADFDLQLLKQPEYVPDNSSENLLIVNYIGHVKKTRLDVLKEPILITTLNFNQRQIKRIVHLQVIKSYKLIKYFTRYRNNSF